MMRDLVTVRFTVLLFASDCTKPICIDCRSLLFALKVMRNYADMRPRLEGRVG